MPNLDPRTKSMFVGLKNELGAVRTLVPRDDYNHGFNAGLDEAMRFVGLYAAGRGLFQPEKDLQQLCDEMEASRCDRCGLTGGQHLQGCGPPGETIFVAAKKAVMRGREFIAIACSSTMARRIARALNEHKPNSRGI